MLFAILARRSGAIGMFSWFSLEAPDKDAAMYIAYRSGFEFNAVTSKGFKCVGITVDPKNLAPLLGGKREIPSHLARMTKLAD